MFRKVSIDALDTATLQAQFLQSLVEHTYTQPFSRVQHSANEGRAQPDIQEDTAIVTSEGLTEYPANVENTVGDETAISPPTMETNFNFALTDPQNIRDVDVSNLDGVTWDEACWNYFRRSCYISANYVVFVTAMTRLWLTGWPTPIQTPCNTKISSRTSQALRLSMCSSTV